MRRTFIALVVAIGIVFPVSASAVVVKFQWNASTGPVAGYSLHQGERSGAYNDALRKDVPGTGTTGEMEMDEASSKYVAATAYDAAGRRSAFSNEILCHPVVVTASAGGSVSPKGTFFVQDGRTITLNVTPNQFFTLKSFTVNGVALPVGTAITIAKRSTIDVVFEEIPIPGPPGTLELLQQISASVKDISDSVQEISETLKNGIAFNQPTKTPVPVVLKRATR